MALHRRGAAVTLLVFLVAPALLRAQTIVGLVVDDISEAPLSTVAIMLLDSTETVRARVESDSAGRFRIELQETGIYRLHAQRLAYGEVLSMPLSIFDTAAVEVTVRLAPEPIEVEGLVVTTEWERVKLERTGFYRRRRYSVGYFLDETDIREQRPMNFTDLLRTIPGIRLRWSQRSRGYVPSSTRGYCGMKVVVDGFPLDLTEDPLDWFVRPEHVIGVEVFPSRAGAPAEFQGPGGGCAMLVVWTR